MWHQLQGRGVGEGGWGLGGRGRDVFVHAQGPGLENSLTSLANGMSRLTQEGIWGSGLQLGRWEDNSECSSQSSTPSSPKGRKLQSTPKGGGLKAPRL